MRDFGQILGIFDQNVGLVGVALKALKKANYVFSGHFGP